MASATRRSRAQRKNKKARSGKVRKRKARRGTTPKFPIHQNQQ